MTMKRRGVNIDRDIILLFEAMFLAKTGKDRIAVALPKTIVDVKIGIAE
jgi:hypothetical protein